MILNYSVKNFQSIADFNLSYENHESNIKVLINNHQVNNSIFFESALTIKDLVINSNINKDTINSFFKNQLKYGLENKITEFNIKFLVDNKVYNFWLILNDKNIIKESLNIVEEKQSRTIYSRDFTNNKYILTLDWNVISSENFEKIENLNQEISIESTLISAIHHSKIKNNEFNKIINWFIDYFAVKPKLINIDQKTIAFLNAFDFNIEAIKQSKDGFDISYKGANNSELTIPLNRESSGLQALFDFYEIFKKNRFYIINDTINHLHPLAITYLLEIIATNTNSQVLVSLNDVARVDKKVISPENILIINAINHRTNVKLLSDFIVSDNKTKVDLS